MQLIRSHRSDLGLTKQKWSKWHKEGDFLHTWCGRKLRNVQEVLNSSKINEIPGYPQSVCSRCFDV